MRPLAALLILVLLQAVFGAAAAEPDPARLDPSMPYQARRANPVTYDVEFVATITAPHGTKLLRVWLPLPPSDFGQEVSRRKLWTFPQDVAPKVAVEKQYGNQFAYFEFVRPQGAQIIQHQFRIRVWELHWDLEAEKLQTVAQWPSAFEPYLRSQQQAVVIDEEIEKLAARFVPRRSGPALELEALFAGVHDFMQYDHTAASLRASSRHAAQNGRGHCSDYHGLCAALGRSLGFPTRVTYGMHAFPKSSPSHCKLEVFLPPHGWVSFDVSETQRLVERIRQDEQLDEAEKTRLAEAAISRTLRGFRDNTWFVQTRGTDYDLAPPASRRVPVVRTLYAEADGQPLPDPDPGNPKQREFAWMTSHKFTPDRSAQYPYQDLGSLAPAP